MNIISLAFQSIYYPLTLIKELLEKYSYLHLPVACGETRQFNLVLTVAPGQVIALQLDQGTFTSLQ